MLARLAVILLAMAAALVIIVRVLEPRMAFFPFRGETTTPHEFGVDYEAVTISTADGERLRAWHLRSENPRALVVYFHGNGANLSNWAPILSGVARHGYSVFAFDYRGYGLSTGRPSEGGLYRDVDAVLDETGKRDHPALIYWGRSLGATMAAYAARKRAPSGVILESGFPDARSLLRTSPLMAFLALFSTYRFSTTDHLKGLSVPVLVMHGDRDSVVPFEHGRALFDAITAPKKQFFVIRGGDHNDAAAPDEGAYWKAVDSFVDTAVRGS